MKSLIQGSSIHQAAKVAGFAILLMSIAAITATDITIGPLIESENPATSFDNINSNQIIFRVGILSWVIVIMCDVLAAWGLFVFLRPVDKGISLLTAWIRIVYTAILGTSLLNLNYVLELIGSDYHAATIGYETTVSQTWLFLNSFDSSWSIGLIVFAFHIFFLGYLALKAHYIPKVLAIFLIVGSVGYLLIHMSHLLIPQSQSAIQILQWIFILPMLSEVALGLWLLIKGKDVQLKLAEQST